MRAVGKKSVPVKVFALDFDIAHAIASLALALLPALLFLACTHRDCVWRVNVEACKDGE